MRDLTGKIAVVTGGASGVGRALGEALVERGAKVVLSDINAEALEATATELRAKGGDVVGVVADVMKQDSVEALADQVYARHGAVHLLFNNAGVGLGDFREPIWTLALKDWDWGFNIHVMGVVHGIRAFVPRMLAGGEDGYVVNTTSTNGGLVPSARTPVYAASKAAVTSLTEVLHHQLTAQDAKVKAALLFPGPHLVNTNLMRSTRPADYVDPASPQPAGKSMMELAQQNGGVPVTEPEEVARFALDGVAAGRFWLLPESERADGNIRRRTDSILARTAPVGLGG
jgi:NAD(P)-dependent dehydrogenase (short-subunit alcohol dehydrogenase family)